MYVQMCAVAADGRTRPGGFVVIRLVKIWGRLSPQQKRLTAEAALYLLWSRLAFGVLPFPVALRVIGCRPGEAQSGGDIAEAQAREIAAAIARCARHVPFRAVCLQQAFASLLMLRRRGLAGAVHFGVRRDSESLLAAHAWSLSGDIPVTGHAVAAGFARIAVFTA